MKYKYTTALILSSLLAEANANLVYVEEWCGKAESRREGCLVVQVKDDGGYVPPNHGGLDSRNGTGTRCARSQKSKVIQ